MDLTDEILTCIDKSVLCWLATASAKNVPNVSPKEIFRSYQSEYVIIANIASPQSVANIEQNENVCVSLIDILVQKGFQLKGSAKIVKRTDLEFPEVNRLLSEMTGGQFPFATVTKIHVTQAKPIIAPRYLLFPDTSEQDQIASAKAAYGF
jgi:predicted pyridoxine 5'-phosphate oxidase superfamily flavin-nucleotide-binding protein